MIEGHGDDLFRYGDGIKYNFSSNIPSSVDHTGLSDHLHGLGDIFGNYPEPSPVSIERLLAEKHGIDVDNVIVTNGATEAIYLIAQLYHGKKSTILIPTFREYQDACSIFSHQLNFVASPYDISGVSDLVWICNPNNPTGLVLDYENFLRIIDRNEKTLFIVDQAYELYSIKKVLSIADVIERSNIIMLKSFTKRYAVPGLRVGYAIGPKNLILNLKKIRMPWSVNSTAIEGAKFLLTHKEDISACKVGMYHEAERLIKEFRDLGIRAYDTDCNFFLAETPVKTAAELKKWLIQNYGILIREASNFEGLTDKYFRIAAQSRKENDILINALKEWMSL